LIRSNMLQNLATQEPTHHLVSGGKQTVPQVSSVSPDSPVSPKEWVAKGEWSPQPKISVPLNKQDKQESQGPFRRLKDFMQALHRVIAKNNKVQLLDPYADNPSQCSRNKAIRLPSMPRTPALLRGPMGQQIGLKMPFTPSYSYFESLKNTPRQCRWASCMRNMQARGTTVTRLQYVPLTQTRRPSPRESSGSCKHLSRTDNHKGLTRNPTAAKANGRKLELPSTLFAPPSVLLPETSLRKLLEGKARGQRMNSQTETPHCESRRSPQKSGIRRRGLVFIPHPAPSLGGYL
jgi:hypothetical protein